VRHALDTGAQDSDFARFVIVSLSIDEVMAIVDAVRSDPSISERVDVKLPAYGFKDVPGIPQELLTTDATTVLRHKECDRDGRLMVLLDESQRQSVQQVEKLDSDVLLSEILAGDWIDAAGAASLLDAELRQQWQAALVAVIRIDRVPVRLVAEYVAATAAALNDGLALHRALGRALPALRLPRFDELFDEIQPAKRHQASQWQQRLKAHWRRESYFAKRDPAQLPFSRVRLREKLEEQRGTMVDEVYEVLSAYVDAQDGSSDATKAPFTFNWPELESFFEEAQKAEKARIGELTHRFYKERDPLLLDDEERAYLENFAQERRARPTKGPDDERFFAAHAQEMREEARLSALWERFVYGQKVECRDLAEGVVQCFRRLFQRQVGKRQLLVIEGVERAQTSFVSLNDDICRFFAARYRGFGDALAGVVEFRSAEAFRYPEFREVIAKFAKRTADAKSRKARQLSFRVWMETSENGDVERSAELRLVWEGDLNAIGIELDADLAKLQGNTKGTPLVKCAGGRRVPSGRSRGSGIDLNDLKGLDPTASRNRGSFVPAKTRCESISETWKTALARTLRDRLIDQRRADLLAGLFREFEDAYRRAIDDTVTLGVSAASVGEQAAAYGRLLAAVVEGADRPVAVETLLRPLLEIGVAQVEPAAGLEPAVIVCPWQPLRLADQRARWMRLRDEIAPLLGVEPTTFTDNGALFFGELQRALAEPSRPDVVTSWLGAKPLLMSQSASLNDYSLHEPPVAIDGRSGTTNDNVREEAKQILAIVESFLRLQPHEKDNLSVVLYNCDAAALPQAVVEGIRASQPEGGEAMCQVMLKHTDDGRLRDLYQQLVTREMDEDGIHASETTRDFMARLRISIMVTQAPTGSGRDGPPYDLVFCHDVISRQARLDWTDVEAITLPAESIDAGHWSRRQPLALGERDAVVLLTCPAQPIEGWQYLDAIGAIDDIRQTKASVANGRHRVPSRMTDLNSEETQRVLDETHRLGAWVINIDDLLDRRQLEDNDIQVIRHKKGGSGGRSLIISSAASDALLRATLRSRLRALDPSYSDEQVGILSRRLIGEANSISGDLVLRAAKRGNNANELIGIVLSKFLVEAELPPGSRFAWVFLDDYASWLGQDEHRMADLLCLVPSVVDGRATLDVIVTEAKFVGAASMGKKATESARQLSDTLRRLEAAMSPENAPADRLIWRARLSEMLMDGMRGSGELDPDGVDWRTALRDEENCTVNVRGHSHVFGHAAPDAVPSALDAFVGVPNTTTGDQERYAPESLRALVRAFSEETSPSAIRAAVRGDSGAPPSSRTASEAPLREPSTVTQDRVAMTDLESAQAPPSAETDVVETADAEVQTASDTVVEDPTQLPRSRFWDLIATYAAAQDRGEDDQEWLKEVAVRCRTALMRYGMSSKIDEKILTPNAALLMFRGSDDLTVAKVESKVTELKTTHGLEVLNVRAQPGRVAISIRRPDRAVLTLARVWRDWSIEPGAANNRLLVAVREDDGAQLFLEPTPAPHTLVAGSTGSGKSVLVQNIILGIAATNTPAQAQIILIDPKAGVDYFAFDPLPHLVDGIIDQPADSLARLEALVVEMERRYALFREARANNMTSYNRVAAEPLPAIWMVHDEFADWMQIDSYREGVEAVVSRLGVKARAAGIYLIFAAQ
ncbi:MAG TPA: FtsK/SpoIIIE domain-containing protein, partial [Sphingomonas sp.]